MAWVRMLHYISGGRPDGSNWPGAGGLLEVSEAEKRDLIIGGNAVHAEAPAKPTPEEPVKSVVVAAPEPEPEPEPGITGVEHPEPLPADPKPAWVEWAVHNGADRDEAMGMTKAQLQQLYGGRL